jgi:Spy/CpxP family protein refolding chaperone
MSFKRKLISAVTSAFAVAAFSTFAAAQDTNTNKEDNSVQKQEMRERGRGGKRGGFGKYAMRSFEKLNLSDAQKSQVQTITENFKTSTQAQREELRSLGMKKRDGIITADEQARAKELRTQLKASGEQMRNSIQAILTAEQKAQLEQMKEEKKKRREEFKQNRLNRKNQTTPQAEVN